MANDKFRHATVVHVKNGRVVLKDDSGHYETIVHKDDPEKISITVIEDNDADKKSEEEN